MFYFLLYLQYKIKSTTENVNIGSHISQKSSAAIP
jgi:hypothetical protein